VTTVRVLRGMLTLTLRRLCWRAPRTVMCVMPMVGSWRCSAKSLEYGISFGVCRGVRGGGQPQSGKDVSEGATGGCFRVIVIAARFVTIGRVKTVVIGYEADN
jgi:hypothetical protein